MMNKGKSSLGPALIELIAAVAVFSLVAAVCLSLFVSARNRAQESELLSVAVSIAQSGVESFKASGGDGGKTADMLGGTADKTGFYAYYDVMGLPTDQKNAWLTLKGDLRTQRLCRFCRLSVLDDSGETVFSLEAACAEEVTP